MLGNDRDALQLEIARLKAEVERLRQDSHQARTDATLAAARSVEAEDRLQAVLDSATDYAIFTKDERGFMTSWNEGAWRLLGWHEDEILGQDARVIFTPEDQAEGVPEQEMRTASNEGRAVDERWHLRKDGSRFWASGLLMPLRGGTPGFLKILRDRTEHLHAARNQTRHLDQMKALAEAARTIMGAMDLSATLQAITDAARDIIGAHQAVCSMTRGPDWSQAVTAVSLSEKYAAWKGYDRMPDGSGIYAWLCERNQTVRMTQAALEAHPRWRAFGEHAREHPPMRGWLATALIGSDGRNLGLIQLSDRVEGEFDETDESIIVQLAQFATSAIERTRAEEEQRANAEFTGRILQASGDCIKVLDLDAKLQFMSAGGQVVMEVDDFEAIKGCPWPEFWSGPERGAAEAAIDAASAGRVGRFQGFTPTVKGTPRWWDVVVTPINGADGKPERLLSVSRDITAERVAQEAITESEARLRFALAAGQLGEWELDIATDTSVRALRHDQIFGYDEPVENWGFETFISHVLPEDRPHVEEKFRQAAETGTGWHFECRIRRVGDGEIRWIAANSQPLRGPDGRVAKIFGFVGDITDRKRVEEALREAHLKAAREAGRTSAILAQIAEGVIVTDASGQITFVNEAAAHIHGVEKLGVAPEAYTNTYHLVTEDGHPYPPEELPLARAVLHGETVEDARWRIRRPDGRDVIAVGSARPIRTPEGDKIGAVLTLRDITARARAEEALRKLNETLGAQVAERTADRDRMWRLSTDVMLVARFDATITAVNPAWTSLLGWHEDELVGSAFMDLVHPNDQASTLAEVGNLSQGVPTQRFENRYQHKDGSYRWLSWIAVPDENFIHAVGRDVTADKERQAALEATQEQLRQAQKMEAVGQLTGGVAHDFNNLLTIIRSSVEFLQRPNLPEERRRRYMEAISETVTRASKLTNQLLAFARRQALNPEVFDVADRVRSVRDMLRTVIGSRIQIVTEIGCDPCFVEADVTQFETALVNMAVNARDAMEGEGRLTVHLREVSRLPELRGHEARQGRFVAVSLTDTGSGIPPDKLGQIFEPFFTTKEVGKGTGLGLSQVFGFAKQSGGDVSVESEVGCGTTFTLYLPQIDRDVDVQGPSSGMEQNGVGEHGQGRRVLVVEDNIEVGQFSTQLLHDLGYETIWAVNADEALRVLAEGARFDVVFTDVVMPGMNGVELGHEIERRHPGLPVVLTSGYSHVLAQEGPHGFELLHKPYTAEEVSRVLRRVTPRP
jgi:PAS domain S-box-containing protein